MSNSNVLVFAERRDGELKKPSIETMTAARAVASSRGGDVAVVALGAGAAGIADTLAGHGASRLYVCEDGFLDLYVPEAYAALVAHAAESAGADVVLMACTSMGKDLAARVAAKLDAGLLSDVVELEDADGRLRAKRPVYSGKALATVAVPAGRRAMATLRPNVFPVSTAEGGSCSVETLASPVAEADVRVRAVRLEIPEKQELDVAEASIIVSGGRGLKAPENFSVVRELASELGAAVGASRAVVDAGWIPHAHQVGQTGKVVSPALYIACGISGAIQHLAGMSSSKLIVAINKDPDAPIFKVADYGIVGDLFEVVPKITEEVRQIKAG